MSGASAPKPASVGDRSRLVATKRVILAVFGLLLVAYGGPLLVTHSPAEGRAAFGFALVVTVGGIAALVSAATGPRSRFWSAGLALAAIALVAILLLAAAALYYVLARPDFD